MSCRIKNGNDQPSVTTSCAPIRLESGTVVGSVVVCHDITRTVELLSEVEYQATHDELTGLLNRRELERQLQCALEHGADSALLLMDLAHFKVINDTCGHAAGDELLRQLADIFKKHTAEHGMAARIGGDEFAILLEDSTVKEAVGVAEGIRAAVQEFRFWYGDRSLGIGINIGAAPFERADQDAAEVMRRAEHACFFAKTHGSSSVYVHRPGDKAIAQRRSIMAWASRLSDAIRLNSLELYHQPIIPADSHPPDKAHWEILVRMRGADDALVNPSQFLPAAERYGLMPELDRWVIQSALSWLKHNPSVTEMLSFCSINLSPYTVGDFAALQDLLRMLDESEVPPEKICFEITETTAISNLARAEQFIKALRSRGCKFALDDFGTGVASFAYLQSLTVDYVKIDGSFVRNMIANEIDSKIVRSINEVGHLMGLKTIAEGVETEAAMEKLKSLHVDYVQGFWIGKPAKLGTQMGLPS